MPGRNPGYLIFSLAIAASPAAEPRHFWDFEAPDPYADRVGAAHAAVTAATVVTLDVGHLPASQSSVTPATVGTANDLVAVPGASLYNPGMEAFSFSGWFRMPTDTANNRGVFDFSGDGGDGPQMLLTSTNSLNFRVDGLGSYNLVSMVPGAAVEDDQWHFFAAVYDPALTSGTLKFYLDGASVSAAASPAGAAASVTPSTNAWLGTFNFKNPAQTENKGLDGSLDDLAYYAGALDESEIQGLFDGSLSPLDLAPPAPIEPAKLISYQRNPVTGQSDLGWESVAGTNYTVWGSTNLESWERLAAKPMPGTGSPLNFSHTPAGSPTTYFYQIQAE